MEMVVVVVGGREMEGNGRRGKVSDGKSESESDATPKPRAWSTRVRGDGGKKEREERNVRSEMW